MTKTYANGKFVETREQMATELQGGGTVEVRDVSMRYPYTHHGPTIYGSKLTDYLVSEASLREDCPDLFEDEKTEPSDGIE